MAWQTGVMLVVVLSVPAPSAHPRASPGSTTRDHRVDAVTTLVVRHVRMEQASSSESMTARLSFAIENGGARPVTDVHMMARLLKPPRAPGESETVMAGPFIIQITEPLPAGYTFDCEIGLRPLPDDCECIPHVEVVSARFSSEP